MDATTLKRTLPSTREFVDGLITELAAFDFPEPSTNVNELDQSRMQIAPQDKQPQNTLSRLPASQKARIKPLMLTLHSLFPNDLLPALDILDRKLVQRFVCADRVDAMAPLSGHDQTVMTGNQSTLQEPAPDINFNMLDEDMFLVTSVSAAPPHPGVPSSTFTQDQEKGYEVRLRAWNCTCPTFALRAFRDLGSRPDLPRGHQPHVAMLHDRNNPVVYSFGGTLTCATDRGSPPVCKHILACVLFARCPGLFGADGDGKRLVSMEELAGWCAGWGS